MTVVPDIENPVPSDRVAIHNHNHNNGEEEDDGGGKEPLLLLIRNSILSAELKAAMEPHERALGRKLTEAEIQRVQENLALQANPRRIPRTGTKKQIQTYESTETAKLEVELGRSLTEEEILRVQENAKLVHGGGRHPNPTFLQKKMFDRGAQRLFRLLLPAAFMMLFAFFPIIASLLLFCFLMKMAISICRCLLTEGSR